MSLFSTELERSAESSLGQPVVVDDLPHIGNISDGELFIIRNNESRYLTHHFHKYAGKFIPHIPRWAMRRFCSEAPKVVLDPFVGSGTTLVEAMLQGHQSYGMDVDPLARLISKVKTTPISVGRLGAIKRDVKKFDSDPTAYGSYVPTIPTLNHWFTPGAISELSACLAFVERYRDDEDIYDFLIICFSSIVRRASNADNQTMKTYVSHTHPKTPEHAKRIFTSTVFNYADRLAAFGALIKDARLSIIPQTIDAKNIDKFWSEMGLPKVDLCVTSPPYIKSVDYLYNQMAELFWIGNRWDLETQPKQNEYKRLYIGNDRPDTIGLEGDLVTGISPIDAYIDRIFSSDKRLGIVVSRYFRDMEQHFLAVRKVMKSGARYILVSGNSTLAGVPVPTSDLLTITAERAGFMSRNYFGYEIRNKHMRFPRGGRGGVVKHDWIIELEAI